LLFQRSLQEISKICNTSPAFRTIRKVRNVMKVMFEELGSELLNSGYRKVAFLEVECKIDGTFRLGIGAEAVIGEHFECPECHEMRPCSGVIATGYCRQPLPFIEHWCGPGKWNFRAKDSQPDAKAMAA
jgi:hypothetical protein